jgi:hypothetical protein
MTVMAALPTGIRTRFRFWIVPLRPGRRTARGLNFDRQRKPKAEEVKRVAKCRFGMSGICNAATDPQLSSTSTVSFFVFHSLSDS